MESKKGFKTAIIIIVSVTAAVIIATCVILLVRGGSKTTPVTNDSAKTTVNVSKSDETESKTKAEKPAASSDDPHSAYGNTITLQDLSIMSREDIEKKYNYDLGEDGEYMEWDETYDADGTYVERLYEEDGTLMDTIYRDAEGFPIN